METFFGYSSDSPCGTVACIAGHAIAISLNFRSLRAGLDLFGYEQKATEALDLKGSQTDRLCYVENWPDRFYHRMYDASLNEDQPEYAKAAADRIDHFIATNGEE